MTLVDIVPFSSAHQAGVDIMMAEITDEFSESIYSPASKGISPALLLSRRYDWVAILDGEVIGTIGIVIFRGSFSVLKNMFLDKTYRSSEQHIALQLLHTAERTAKENKCTSVFLGTMEQFKAAQRFYEKNGFSRIKEKDLPADFPGNEIDTVFFRKEL